MKNVTRASRGFTLIELIIVISIIGILAAIALPRLIAAQTDARVAKAQAIYGSVRTAAALARSRCELDRAAGKTNCPANDVGAVNMDGTDIATINSYPRAMSTQVGGAGGAVNGILSAAQVDVVNDNFDIVQTQDTAVATNFYFMKIRLKGAVDMERCMITYLEAKYENNTIVAPVISLDTGAC